MKHSRSIEAIIIAMIILSVAAAATGIFSGGGSGRYGYRSIRGGTVEIYGEGIYRHMSADVAVQGKAQDYVTLFIGVPLLIIGLALYRRRSLRGGIMLAGTVGYFLVTYLFYMCMAMFNELFLVYVALTSLAFFALAILMISFDTGRLADAMERRVPKKFAGGFLIFNSIAIALLWLSRIVPPLLDGTIYPEGLHHYTTLIVQGMDLSLMLPLAFVSGLLFVKGRPFGYLLGPVYTGFLAIMMTALTAKIIGMSLAGVPAGPAIVIIPAFNITAIVSWALILGRMGDNRQDVAPGA